MIVYLDFETYFDTHHNLKKLNYSSYVRAPEFKVWQVGIRIDDGPIEVIHASDDDDPSDPIADHLHNINWSEATLVCHNTLFDGFILSEHYKIIPKFYCDTLGMARALHFWEDNDLASLDKRYGGEGKTNEEALQAVKGIRNPTQEQYHELAKYCLGDIIALQNVFNSMLPQFPTSELKVIDTTIRLFTQPVLTVDPNKLAEVAKREKEEKQALLDELGVTAKELRSAPKFAKILRDHGVQVPMKKNDKGNDIPAFSKKDAGFLALRHDARVGKYIQAKLRVQSNILETRALALIEAAKEGYYLPVGLNYWGAITGRWSGANGINMQNLPKEGGIRRAVLAPEGHVLVVSDASQIECRLTAWFANQSNLLDVFRAGRDPYCEFGSVFYGFPINKEDHPVQRFISKCAVLGLGYGMGADTFYEDVENKADQYGIELTDWTLDGAEAAKQTFRGMYSNIPALWSNCTRWINIMAMEDYQDEWKGVVFQKEKIHLPNGLFIHYPGLRRDGKHDHGRVYGSHLLENIIQCLARIVVAGHLVEIAEHYKVVMTTHDEIVVCVPEEKADSTLAHMIDIMRQPPDWCADLPLDAEGKYRRYYSK